MTAVRLILLPAVDVVEGRAVRLMQGKAGSETEYGSALDAAMNWQRDGAEWIHLVDLDAAFGRGSNRELLAEVVGRLDVEVELSGGIRDDDSLKAALDTGCARVNLGTAQAVMHALVHGGELPPIVQRQGPRIYNVTGPVRASGGTILCFVGPPHKSVAWRILQGVGTLTPFTTFTDEQGRCSCRFDAAVITGTVVIGAAWVP